MRISAAIFTMIALTSCGGLPELDRPARGFDPVLQGYMTDFYAETDAHGLYPGHDIWSAKFGDPNAGKEDGSFVGLCTIQTAVRDNGMGPTYPTFRTIVIISDMDPLFTKTVMYHELGHCAYDLEHVDDPDAMMYPIAQVPADEAELHQLTVDMLDTVPKARHRR